MSVQGGNLKVELEGRGEITLRPSDYVAQGGQGIVYRAHKTVVKIYHDVSAMRRDGLPDKLKLLSGFRHPYVISPEGLVFDQNRRAVGFYMPFTDGEPMSRVFTTAFRRRVGFGDAEAKQIVQRMREVVQFAHQKGAVLVDANELNWLVLIKGSNAPEPRIIDVDSWSIGRWPAKVVMLSIRDWHTKSFNQLTDWFAWGVVTFQLFTGIHPYKGSLPGYAPGDLEGRMKTNASVFSPGVSLNQAVRDFNCIPGRLLDWYRAVFHQGERSLPPSPYDQGMRLASASLVMRAVTTATGSLVFEELFGSVGDLALRVWPSGAVLLASGKIVDLSTKQVIAKMQSCDGEIVRVPNGWLVADWIGGVAHFSFFEERTGAVEAITFSLQVQKLVRYENRLFAATESELVELKFMFVSKALLSVGRRTQILRPKATQWFDGLGVQEALGAVFLILPFGESSCTTVRAKELDGFKALAAKAGERFASVVVIDKNGLYRKFDFVFDRDYRTYRVDQTVTDSPDLNLAILPKGVNVTITNDGEFVIRAHSTGETRKVEDSRVNTNMLLAHWESRVVYLSDGRVWSVRTI